MRVRSFTAMVIAASVLSLAPGLAPSATAQVRSADQITKDLTPSAAMLTGPTRGIRPAAPPAGSPAGSNSYVPASAGKAAAPSAHHSVTPASSLTVQFKTGSAELTPQAVAQLNELGKALSGTSMSAFRFRVEGHTDTVGAKDTNLTLSEHRAQAVAAYLESKFGVSRERVEPVGLGSEHPLVPTPDQTAEPRNRRVQVINLGA